MNNPAWTARVLSVPGIDTDLSLYVSFDSARFCFGAGEGTQRAFIQKRTTWRHMQAVFLPDGASGRGGLPGIIMTAADAGLKELTVVGPPDTNAYIASLRGCVARDAFPVHSTAYPRDSTALSEQVYDSKQLSVHAIALRPSESELGSSEYPSRPTQFSQKQLDTYTAGIAQDMFGRASGAPRPHISAPLFQGMNRLAVPDDRYPLPVTSDADIATDMVYVCRAPDTRGKFDVGLAKQLNIPNGPIRALITQGQTVEFDDPTAPGGKRTVRPEDCLVGGGPGAILVVVSCREYNIDRLVTSKAFAPLQMQDGEKPQLLAHKLVHRVSRAVWEDKRYQAWMETFGPDAEHLFADTTGTDEIFFGASAWNALRLSMINPDIFTVPYNTITIPPPPILHCNAKVLEPNHVSTMHPPAPTSLMPRHPNDERFPTSTSELESAREEIAKAYPEYIEAVKAAQESVAEAEKLRGDVPSQPGDDIVVTTLGTGSAVPSKYRNVSATHLEIPGVGGILLDCGEGTLGQMRRKFGPDGMKQMFDDLRVICVSHMHADHHLGLCSILADRFKLGVTSKLYLVAPYAIALQLEETGAWQHGVSREALENVKFIDIKRLRWGWQKEQSTANGTPPPPAAPTEEPAMDESSPQNASAFCEATTVEDVVSGKRKWPFRNVFRFHPSCVQRADEIVADLVADLGLTDIITPTVKHRGMAYGLVLTHQSGWKVAYSGDTQPCASFIQAGQGATIVIHEATIEDDEPELAASKGHSTFGQAIEVGKRMNARYIVLNHFSQRYPKAPKLQLSTAEESSTTPDVAISFDFMSLRAADTWKIAHYMPAIEVLFKQVEKEDGEDDEEDKAGNKRKGEQPKQKQKQGKQPKQPKQAKQGKKDHGNDARVKRSSTDSPDQPQAKKRALEHVQERVESLAVDGVKE